MPLRFEKSDEDLNKISRKPREKKPQHKFSVIYTFPISVLNEGKGRGKRSGFNIYDSLVCKLCKPSRFFHSRDALKLHSSEDHDERSFSVPVTRNIVQKKSRRNRTVECISLDSDDDSDNEDIEVMEIVGDSMDETLNRSSNSLDDTFMNRSVDGIECLDILEDPVEVTPMFLVSEDIPDASEDDCGEGEISLEKVNDQNKNTSTEAGIECVDIEDDPKEDSNQEDNEEDADLLEVTIQEEENPLDISGVTPLVTLEEVDAENSHIRNLLKEFDTPKRDKRKQENDNDNEASKRLCIGDEALLAEDNDTKKSENNDIVIEQEEEKKDEKPLMILSSFSFVNETLDDNGEDVVMVC